MLVRENEGKNPTLERKKELCHLLRNSEISINSARLNNSVHCVRAKTVSEHYGTLEKYKFTIKVPPSVDVRKSLVVSLDEELLEDV